jgi:hypothetical protein
MPYELPSAGARWLQAHWLELGAYRFEWLASFGADGPAGHDGPFFHDRDLDAVIEQVLPFVPDLLRDLAFAFCDGQEFERGVPLDLRRATSR